MDAIAAFLQPEVDNKEIFMNQPEMFENKRNLQKVCRLNKALYGLKQSSRLWNQKLDTKLKEIGLIQATFD